MPGQNACSSALKLGTSGGGIVDHGWPLLVAIREARAGRMFAARGSRCGHVSMRCEKVSGVPTQSGQSADSTALGLKRLRFE